MAGHSTIDLSVRYSLIETLHEFFSKSLFTDVTLRCRGEAESTNFVGMDTFQLLLASVSPMLREALRDSAEGSDVEACIIVPDMSVAEVTEIHERILFNTNGKECNENCDFKLADSCKLLGIEIDVGTGDSKMEGKTPKYPLINALKNGKPLFVCTE